MSPVTVISTILNVSVIIWDGGDSQRVQAGRGNLFHHVVQEIQQYHAGQPDPEDLLDHLDPGTGQK